MVRPGRLKGPRRDLEGRDGRRAGCWVGGLGPGGRDEGVGFGVVGIGLEGGCDSVLELAFSEESLGVWGRRTLRLC